MEGVIEWLLTPLRFALGVLPGGADPPFEGGDAGTKRAALPEPLAQEEKFGGFRGGLDGSTHSLPQPHRRVSVRTALPGRNSDRAVLLSAVLLCSLMTGVTPVIAGLP